MIMGVVFNEKNRKLYNVKYQKNDSYRYYVLKNENIKDTRTRRTYWGRKWRETGYVYLKVSSYSDAEGLSQLIFFLHDAINNTAQRMGQKIDKLELYRQCLPRIVKDTYMAELEKCECVLSVITIAPVLNIDREKMGAMVILLVIDDGAYVCIYTAYSSVFKELTQPAFFYDSIFNKREEWILCCNHR